MKVRITCDCGDSLLLDSNRYRRAVDAFNDDSSVLHAVDEWKREHLRFHEKDGDHDDHSFSSEIVR